MSRGISTFVEEVAVSRFGSAGGCVAIARARARVGRDTSSTTGSSADSGGLRDALAPADAVDSPSGRQTTGSFGAGAWPTHAIALRQIAMTMAWSGRLTSS